MNENRSPPPARLDSDPSAEGARSVKVLPVGSVPLRRKNHEAGHLKDLPEQSRRVILNLRDVEGTFEQLGTDDLKSTLTVRVMHGIALGESNREPNVWQLRHSQTPIPGAREFRPKQPHWDQRCPGLCLRLARSPKLPRGPCR
jgi:hypothetical protein